MIIWCDCSRYTSSCPICRNGRAAYRAGRRAYRQGRSSRAKHGHHGYGYRWSAGWEDARNANPNTAARRAKEKETRRQLELRRLRRERTVLDHRIKALTS